MNSRRRVGGLEHRIAGYQHMGTCLHQFWGVGWAHAAVYFNEHLALQPLRFQ
jgi:hypothetical protein